MELIGNLFLIASIQSIVYILIMIRILRVLCCHGRSILAHIHDIGHIKRILRCQPVIQNQQLLILGLCAGCLDSLDGVVALAAHGITIVLYAQLVAVHKGHNGAGQIVIAVVAVSDSINRSASQNQHLAQNAKTVFALVIVLHVERKLCTQYICVCLPVVLILLEHIQNLLLLFRGQLFLFFGAVCLGRLYSNVFQFLLYGLDSRIRCINGCILGIIRNHCCIDVRLVHAERNLLVSYGNRTARRDFLLSSSFVCLCVCFSGL